MPERLRQGLEAHAEQLRSEREDEIDTRLRRKVGPELLLVDGMARLPHTLGVVAHVPAPQRRRRHRRLRLGGGRSTRCRGRPVSARRRSGHGRCRCGSALHRRRGAGGAGDLPQMLRLRRPQHVEVVALARGDRRLHLAEEAPHLGGAAGHAATQHVVVPGVEAEQPRVLAAQPAEFDQRGEVGLAAAGIEGTPHALASGFRFGALQHRAGGRIVEAEQVAALGIARRTLPDRLGNAAQLVGAEGDAAAVLAQAAVEGLRLPVDLGVDRPRAFACGRRQGDAGILELVEFAAQVGTVDVVGRLQPRQQRMHGRVLAEPGVEGVDREVATLGGVAHGLVGMDGDQHAERSHRVGSAQPHAVERGEQRPGAGCRVRRQRQRGLAALQVGEQRSAGRVDLGGAGKDGEHIRQRFDCRGRRRAADRRSAGRSGSGLRFACGRRRPGSPFLGNEGTTCDGQRAGRDQRGEQGPDPAGAHGRPPPPHGEARRSQRCRLVAAQPATGILPRHRSMAGASSARRSAVGRDATATACAADQNHASSIVRQVSSRLSTGASQAATRGSS